MQIEARMSIGPLINLASGYVQSLIPGLSTSSSSSSTNQLSPFAQVLGNLQQLEQSNPIQYQTVTQQISSNLQTAAQSATTSGNTALANQLTQLSTDFNSASTSSQLPNVQDLAQAIGASGGHHHHHHHSGSSSAPPASSATTSTMSNPSGILGAQTGSNPNPSLSALSIIDNALTGAGL
jgi:hypothetical protein